MKENGDRRAWPFDKLTTRWVAGKDRGRPRRRAPIGVGSAANVPRGWPFKSRQLDSERRNSTMRKPSSPKRSRRCACQSASRVD